MNIYQQHILDHAQYPRHWGRVDPADITLEADNPLCGDRFVLTGQIEHGRLTKFHIRGEGCMISKAAASILAEYVQGKSLHSIREMSSGDMLELLGIELTTSRLRCGLLAWEALQKGIQEVYT